MPWIWIHTVIMAVGANRKSLNETILSSAIINRKMQIDHNVHSYVYPSQRLHLVINSYSYSMSVFLHPKQLIEWSQYHYNNNAQEDYMQYIGNRIIHVGIHVVIFSYLKDILTGITVPLASVGWGARWSPSTTTVVT